MDIALCSPTAGIVLRGKPFTFATPWVMGIVNVTPDSFFAGSRCTSEQAIAARVRQLVAEGADVLDVGACSTRPGTEVVSEHDEIERLRTALAVVRREAPGTPVSVDTFRARVAREAVETMGADIINDIAGGDLDAEMWHTVARLGVPYIVMHMRGTPATMQTLTQYDDVVADVVDSLADKMRRLRDIGVDNLIADPGFGFAKTLEQNYALFTHLDAFARLEAPLLVGISRKSMISRALGITADDALNGTTVLNTLAMAHGAHIVRVHDAKAAVEARRLLQMCCAQQSTTTP